MAGRRQLLWPVGAPYVGVFQSILAPCRLQGIDPYTCLVDILRRVEAHLPKQVALLTPRLLKEQ